MKSKEEAIKALQALTRDDPEEAHIKADDILCEVLDAHGLKEVADAWRAACERCHFWYA